MSKMDSKLANNVSLSATGPTIVPLAENAAANAVVPNKTGSLKPIVNSKKIYLRDLPSYVSDMMSDSGFKFTEEYEVLCRGQCTFTIG